MEYSSGCFELKEGNTRPVVEFCGYLNKQNLECNDKIKGILKKRFYGYLKTHETASKCDFEGIGILNRLEFVRVLKLNHDFNNLDSKFIKNFSFFIKYFNNFNLRYLENDLADNEIYQTIIQEELCERDKKNKVEIRDFINEIEEIFNNYGSNELESKLRELLINLGLENIARILNPIHDYFVSKGLLSSFQYFIETLRQSFLYLSLRHFNFRTIRPSGIRLILEEVIDQNQQKEFFVQVCDNYKQFKEYLINLKVLDQNLAYFIVKHDLDLHVTPLFFERSDGQLNIIITDSISKIEGNYIESLEKVIVDIFPGANIFIYNHQRQKDGKSCSIFSIEDLLQVIREPSILNSIKSHGRPYTPQTRLKGIGMNHFLVDTLPLIMMRLSQSDEALKAIDCSIEKDQFYTKKNGKRKNVLESIKKHINGDKFNLFVQKRYMKYQNIILKKSLEEGFILA